MDRNGRTRETSARQLPYRLRRRLRPLRDDDRSEQTGRGLLPAHLRLPRTRRGGGQIPRRLPETRRSPGLERGSHRSTYRPPDSSALPERVLQRRSNFRQRFGQRPTRRPGRHRDERRVGGAPNQPASVRRPARLRPLGLRRRRIHRLPDGRPTRKQRTRPHRLREYGLRPDDRRFRPRTPGTEDVRSDYDGAQIHPSNLRTAT